MEGCLSPPETRLKSRAQENIKSSSYFLDTTLTTQNGIPARFTAPGIDEGYFTYATGSGGGGRSRSQADGATEIRGLFRHSDPLAFRITKRLNKSEKQLHVEDFES
jgi:hypothetical protein